MMTTNYREESVSDAKYTVQEFRDQIAEMLVDDGKASDDLHNDYGSGDAWHHESHVDKEYDLQESAELLSQLRDHEETDSGLWEGLEPQQAISAQAAYTYGNAVLSEWRDLIEEINDRWEEVGPLFTSLEEAGEACSDELPGLAYPDFAALKKQAAEQVISEVLA